MHTACSQEPAPAPAPEPTAVAPATAAAAQARTIEWVTAPEGDLAEAVKAESARARRDGRALLVYVGATWCEPCQRFHEAAERDELPGGLPPLRIVELDLDRDGERLSAAGYGSKMIPLFVVPGPDGRGTSLRVEGGIKGERAAANLTTRLRALLARAGRT